MTALALSIRQPWSWAILVAGKRCENRTWNCKYRGPIYIHAAKGMKREEYESFAYWWQHQFPGRRPLQTYPALPLPRVWHGVASWGSARSSTAFAASTPCH